MKHDVRHESRLVDDGNITNVLLSSVCSGVVPLRGLSLVLFLAEINGLEPWGTDIGNDSLEGFTKEKFCIVASPEFGPFEGYNLMVVKDLHGLRTSGLR